MLLFWRHGYDGVSVAQLGVAMGIAPPSLYAAFGSKEALYREALERYLATLGRLGVEELAQSGDAGEGVRTLLRTAASAFSRPGLPGGCMVGIGALRCAEGSEVAEQATAQLRGASAQVLLRRIERARREGEIDSQSTPRALADFYSAVIEGMSVLARDGASGQRLQAVADAAMAAWPQRRPRRRVQQRAA